MRVRIGRAAAVLALTLGLPAAAYAAGSGDEAPDEQGDDVVPVEETIPYNPAAVTSIPAGCAQPPVPQMVFVGDVETLGEASAVFRVLQIRAGTPGGYLQGDRVEVRYGRDAQFLEVGVRYVVGAQSDALSPLLVSKVRTESPLFGGDAVLGVTEGAGRCPRIEDPIRTIREDGEPIDAGLLRPLTRNAGLVLVAVGFAVGLGLFALYGAALIRQFLRAARGGVRRR